MQNEIHSASKRQMMVQVGLCAARRLSCWGSSISVRSINFYAGCSRFLHETMALAIFSFHYEDIHCVRGNGGILCDAWRSAGAGTVACGGAACGADAGCGGWKNRCAG